MMETNGLVEGYSFWTFTDIFEENYFPSVPFHGGFGLLNVHGIAKPIYRAFELLHKLGTEGLPTDGIHETVDAWVVRGEHSVTVLLTNHALPRHPIEQQRVKIHLAGMAEPRGVYVERIDETHANAPRVWHDMGAPEYLSPLQVEQLHAASQTLREPQAWTYENGNVHLELDLPAHAVAAITLELTGERQTGGDKK